MNSLLVILISIVCFIIAYVFYGAWLAKQWGIDPSRKTPAHTRRDGMDYVPTKAPVLLGHHFASIAGAGPITGPIAAAIFGWVPVLLWVIVGCIFFGGVQDFGALFASVRHDGKSLGEVIEVNIGKTGKKLFAAFAWLTLLLVIAAFTNIIVNTFVAVPAAASASMMFMVLAVAFGYFVYQKGASLGVSSVIGVVLMFVCIVFGNMFPLVLSWNAWVAIIIAYIFIASVTPVWILLQPRDYLNSFLLYAMLIGTVLGILIMRPVLVYPAFTTFNVGGQWMFPMLFVTVACGAISGFHSLIGSGTTSKQIDNEADTRLIGYGSMLIEGVLAVIAVITAAYIGADKFAALAASGGPTNVFSDGAGNFMTSLGIPFNTAKSFIALAISAFALTSLDTATRLGRFVMQEFFYDASKEKQSPLCNLYVSSVVTVGLGGWLALTNWSVIWPIFGSANQLFAGLALLSVAVWLKKSGKNYKMFTIPITFMLIVTALALIQLIQVNMAAQNYILVIFPVLLLALAVVLAAQGYKIITNKTEAPIEK